MPPEDISGEIPLPHLLQLPPLLIFIFVAANGAWALSPRFGQLAVFD